MLLRLIPPLFAAALLVAACETVPITGRSQLQLVSEGDELRMGLQAYQQVLRKERSADDAVATEMLVRVGSRIAAATGRTDYRWEFRLFDDDKQINAFCLPGGKVGVFTGILAVTRDEAGLAAVIGHEVAHAIARHGGERVSQQLVAEGLTVAVVVGTQDQRRASTYAGLLGLGATVGVLLPYSRLQESEADRLGLIYMAKAGYDPAAARELWLRMREAGRGKAKPPEILSTHPADDTRIRNIERWLPEARQYYHGPR